MTKREFYRTTFKIVVLSEDRYSPTSVRDIAYDITDGELVGTWDETNEEVLDGEEIAGALLGLGSDPEWFNLDEDGNDLEESQDEICIIN